MTAISSYFARKSLAHLSLTEAVRQHAERLLDLTGDDHRINVADIHEKLFPLNTPASANASLNRLLRQINEAAVAQGISLQAEITADKKVGAKNRWVWFEGVLEAPAPAYTSELDAIPPTQLVSDQRGIPLGELPVVVLLTFNRHETAAVIRQFHPQGVPEAITRDRITYNLLGEHEGMRIVHCISKQGGGASQNATHDAFHAWHPQAIIGVGIAFGVNPAKQRIGDVLISESVRGYELSRINADGTVTLRGPKPPASSTLFQRFDHIDQTCSTDPEACLHWPTIHFGTLLSGDKLVDNLDYRNSLLSLESEAIGGEMEGVGIHIAAERHQVDWIIVKAICDWGDGNKSSKTKERDQQLAAKHAALVAHQALALGNLYGDILPSPQDEEQWLTRRSKPPAKPPSVRSMNLFDREAIPTQILIEDAKGLLATLKKDAHPEIGDSPEQQGVGAMEYLLQWLDEPGSPSLFALLGEYGMGKTVTCQRLAESLELSRRQDPTRPLPLYFDLRHITGLDRRVPKLQEVIEECMARGWLESSDPTELTMGNFFRWVEQGAVVIFDGLDEVLVKLKEADGQIFTNELLRLPRLIEARPHQAGGIAPRPKLLISCRTQYFRTLRDQQNHFTGQERGEHSAEKFRALVLLPLDEEQVMRYLAGTLPGNDPDLLLNTIRAVHNLEELTHRPYTLKMVADFIPDIERERLSGKTIYGVTLYRRMVSRWLDRDQGKHHIRPEHKMRLAAHLAAHLWKTGNGALPADKIENWFHAWLETEPNLRRRYAGLHPDQLEEDLRTATFLSRQDDRRGSSFRFAHTSLLEFFLADYMLQGLQNDAPQHWAMQVPSQETLDFLGQMLAEAGDPTLLQTLQRWRTDYRPLTSELLLAYAMWALKHGWPAPLLHGIRLTGAQLSDWIFRGPVDGAPLDLSEADFSGATLHRAVFERAKLSGASFRDAQLAQCNWLDCDACEADWRGSECSAAIWRRTRLDGVSWQGARGYRPQLISCPGIPLPEPATPNGPDFLMPQFAPPLPDDWMRQSDTALRWLSGHSRSVLACAFSPDGARLLSAGDDGTLRLWDAESGETLRVMTGHEDRVQGCAFSPDGARLLSASSDGLRLRDAESGETLRVMTGHEGWVSGCAFSPDGARLLSAGHDGSLRLWDAESGETLRVMTGHEGWVSGCAFSPDGARLLSAGNDGSLRLWDAESGETLRVMTGHEGWVSGCAFSPDGARLLSAGDNGSLCLWDAESGETLRVMTGHEGWVSGCAFSPDGARLLSAGHDGSLRLWDAESGETLRVMTGLKGMVLDCAFSPDGARLLSAGDDGSLRLWDAESGETLRVMTGHEDRVRGCAFSPDGARLLSAGDDGSLRLWDAESGETLRVMTGLKGMVLDCAFSPDGARLLSAGHDGSLRLWDAESGETLRVMTGHEDWVSGCAFSPDGARLLSAGNDGSLRLWDAESGETLRVMTGHEGWVSGCAFSPDGARLLSAGNDGSLRLWDAESGETLRVMTGHEGWVSGCAFSPDGARLLSAGHDGSLRLWDAESGETLRVMTGHEGWVRGCAFSPDGARLLSAGNDGTLRLWDAESGETLRVMTGHEGWVSGCAFSPDGARLLSAGNDGSLRLWDAENGQLLRIHVIMGGSYQGHAVWLPVENRLIEASGDTWRCLAWVWPGHDGWPERLPAEFFGPLPAPKRLCS